MEFPGVVEAELSLAMTEVLSCWMHTFPSKSLKMAYQICDSHSTVHVPVLTYYVHH